MGNGMSAALEDVLEPPLVADLPQKRGEYASTVDRLAAFEQACMPHYRALFRYALRLTRNEQTAADLLQEAYLRAYRSFEKFTPGTNVSAWLYCIVRNTHTNYYLQQRRRPEHVDIAIYLDDGTLPTSDSPDGDANLQREETTSRIAAALGRVSQMHGDVVRCVDMMGNTYRRTAEILGIPFGTVMSRLHRGRKRLQQELMKDPVIVDYLQELGIVPYADMVRTVPAMPAQRAGAGARQLSRISRPRPGRTPSPFR